MAHKNVCYYYNFNIFKVEKTTEKIVDFQTKKYAKKLAYFKYFLYLCTVIKELITRRERPPDVVGRIFSNTM